MNRFWSSLMIFFLLLTLVEKELFAVEKDSLFSTKQGLYEEWELEEETSAFANRLKERSRFQKGAWFIGVDLGVSGSKGNDDYLVANIDYPELRMISAKASINGGYFFNELNAISGYIEGSFGRKKTQIVSKVTDLFFDAALYDVNRVSNAVEVGVGYRNYIPLTPTGRFYFFTQIAAYYSFNRTLTRNVSNPGAINEKIKKIFSDVHKFGLGAAPGFLVFINKRLSVTMNLGVMGLNLTKEFNTVDSQKRGTTLSASFRNDYQFLNFNAGMSYFFGLKQRRVIKKNFYDNIYK